MKCISKAARIICFTGILALTGMAHADNAEKTDAEVPPEVLKLTATFNDEAIPFNDKLIILGRADAPLTSVFVFGLSGDATYLVNRWLPELISKYVDSGKMKLVVIEFPLTWHDMQAFSAFRCVSTERHWELLKESVRYPQPAFQMKKESAMNAPDHIWRMMKSYDVPRDKAEKCMRNNAIVGHIEAQRHIVTDTWNTTVAPSFVVGDKVLINPSSAGVIEAAIESALKGGK